MTRLPGSSCYFLTIIVDTCVCTYNPAANKDVLLTRVKRGLFPVILAIFFFLIYTGDCFSQCNGSSGAPPAVSLFHSGRDPGGGTLEPSSPDQKWTVATGSINGN